LLPKHKAEWEEFPLCFSSFIGKNAHHGRQGRPGFVLINVIEMLPIEIFLFYNKIVHTHNLIISFIE
jgi:hypothetical protein